MKFSGMHEYGQLHCLQGGCCTTFSRRASSIWIRMSNEGHGVIMNIIVFYNVSCCHHVISFCKP